MGQLMDLWVPAIQAGLRANGSVVRQTESLDVKRWRRAARQAGSALGWSIRTGVSADGSTVWATSPKLRSRSDRAGVGSTGHRRGDLQR